MRLHFISLWPPEQICNSPVENLIYRECLWCIKSLHTSEGAGYVYFSGDLRHLIAVHFLSSGPVDVFYVKGKRDINLSWCYSMLTGEAGCLKNVCHNCVVWIPSPHL